MIEAKIAWVLLLDAAATWALTGIVWFVQVIHYPVFRVVEPGHFPGYQQLNLRLTGIVTGPLMLIEGVTSVWLVFRPPPAVAGWTVWLGLALLGAVWANTALQVVPTHVRLQEGFDERLYARLLSTNLVRTFAWTARSVLLLALVRATLA